MSFDSLFSDAFSWTANRNHPASRAGQAPDQVRGRLSLENALSQIATKALDAFAGFLEVGVFRGIGNPERGAEPERRTLHHRDAFGLQQLADEILVIGDHLAGRRSLADGAGAGRVDIERALRPRTIDALGLVEHPHHQIAPLLERLVVHRDEILRTV